jgi:hypothetical protein
VPVLRAIVLSVAVLLFAGLLLAGLWPFEFSPVNETQWMSGKDGLRAEAKGIAYTRAEMRLIDPGHDAFCIEMTALSASASSGRIRRLISIMGPDMNELLFVGQWESSAAVRFRSNRFAGGYREFGAVSVFQPMKPAHLIISYGKGALSLFANGAVVADGTMIPLQSLVGILIVGNSPNGANGWVGEIGAIRVSHKAIQAEEAAEHFRHWRESGTLLDGRDASSIIAEYTFSERSGRTAHNSLGPAYDLLIPARMVKKDLQLLHFPLDEMRLSRYYVYDVIVNSLGFIPFGFCAGLFMLSLPGMRVGRLLLWATASGGFISLTIEVLQAFTINRSSQLSDLILNTLGTLVGAVCCLLPLLLYGRGDAAAVDGRQSGAGRTA